MEADDGESGKGVVLIYATFPDVPTATRIARQLVSERLIACGNVYSGVRSVFVWEGTVNEADEAVMIAKTHRSQQVAVTRAITALHPYDVPAIAVVPIEGGHQEFLRWVGAEIESTPLADLPATPSDEAKP